MRETKIPKHQSSKNVKNGSDWTVYQCVQLLESLVNSHYCAQACSRKSRENKKPVKDARKKKTEQGPLPKT